MEVSCLVQVEVKLSADATDLETRVNGRLVNVTIEGITLALFRM